VKSPFAYLAYASLWLQSVLGLSPIHAGPAVIPGEETEIQHDRTETDLSG